MHKHTGNIHYSNLHPPLLLFFFALDVILRSYASRILLIIFIYYTSIIFACIIIFSGVPQALISANAIDYLCDLFSSSNDTTIGIASVALGYLSYVPEGQRKLLHRYL